MAPTDGRLQELTDHRTSRPRAASLSPSGGSSSLAPPKKRKCSRPSLASVAPPSPMETVDPVSPPLPMDSMDVFEPVTPPSTNPFIAATRSATGALVIPNSLPAIEGFQDVTPPSSTNAIGSANPPVLSKVFSPIPPPWYSSPNSHVLSSAAPSESSLTDTLLEHSDRIMRSRGASVSPSARDLSLVPPRKRKCCIGVPDENTLRFLDSSNIGCPAKSLKTTVSQGISHGMGASSDVRVRLWEVQKPVSAENNGLSFILRRIDLCDGMNKGRGKRLISEDSTGNRADTTLRQCKKRTVLKEVANVLCDGVSRCPSLPAQKAQV
jgi:hypothetical protein